MKVLIAGGSGFLGQALAADLSVHGHTPVLLTRGGGPGDGTGAGPRRVNWTPDGSVGAWAREFEDAGAVVNLAGESIAAGRWSVARKQRILDSRVQATRSVVAAIAHAAHPPPVLVNGSAVGYYGPLGDLPATEEDAAGHDFLASVCTAWEAEAARAASARTRVVRLRTGLPLSRKGGALPPMLPPFWFGVGGPLGSGQQYWPWIHLQDWTGLVRFAIEQPAVVGALNATAPNPVPNKVFVKALGRAMHRPAFMPAPGFMLRLLLGEMADALILSGQRAVPRKAETLGYRFAFTDIDAALTDLFR